MDLKVLIPEKVLYEGKAKSVLITTETGEIEILPHHTALFTKVSIGEITYTDSDNKKHHLAVKGGFAQVENNVVSVILDTATPIDEIDIQKVQQAKLDAEKMLSQESIDNLDQLKAQLQLADLHLKLYKKYHTSRNPNFPIEEE